jgi:hypothetical protein
MDVYSCFIEFNGTQLNKIIQSCKRWGKDYKDTIKDVDIEFRGHNPFLE